MKKLLNKFTSIFLAVVVLMSWLLSIPVSATETITSSETSSSELIYDFDAVPLSIKADLYDDSGIKYDNYLIVKQSNIYRFMLFDSDVDFLDLGSTQLIFYKGDFAVNRKLYVIFYNHDGTFKKQHTFSTRSYEYFGYTYAYDYDTNSNDYIENWVNNVVYSSLDVKYNGLTVYYAKNNKAVTIKDLVNLPAGTGGGEIVGPQPIPSQPGDYDFIGPLPLIPIEGDPTFQGFKDWLIKNKKYEDLADYGINCTASNISAVVDLWTGNYNSITGFFSSLKSAWSTINAVSQAKNIYNWLEEQWRIYKKSLITYETIPIESQVIDSSTDYDENGNFISSETAYLKLILNVLNTFRNDFNNISSIINDNIIIISNNIYRIASQLSSIPQYIADSTYNNFVEPFNLVLEAINSIQIDGSSTTNNNINVNVDIDNIDNSDNEFSIAFGDLQVALENKFSFYNQLTEITNTVQNYDYGDGSTPPEIYISTPDNLSVENMSLDFSLYEPYREPIKKIIIAVAYISFAISLLYRLPKIIGGI